MVVYFMECFFMTPPPPPPLLICKISFAAIICKKKCFMPCNVVTGLISVYYLWYCHVFVITRNYCRFKYNVLAIVTITLSLRFSAEIT